MQHYWGAKAICDRIGYRNSGRLIDLILKYHVPAYKRHHPLKRNLTVYYSNDDLLLKWDLARAQQARERLIAEREQRQALKQEKDRHSPRGVKKRPSHVPNT